MSTQLGVGTRNIIGAKAAELFSQSDFSGRVLAVVSSAVYLSATGSEILWLAQQNLPKHTRSILGYLDLTALRAGMSFEKQAQCLQFDKRASLDLTNASVWQPSAIQPDQLARPKTVNTRLRQVLGVAQRLDCANSFGQAIPLIEAIANGNCTTGASSNSMVSAALGSIKEIACACCKRDIDRVAENGRALIGLGYGLTPSGDDFLGGLFFVAYHLKAACPNTLYWNQQPIDDLLDWARTHTNPISHTILCDHTRGQGAEPLHNLVGAILAGEEPADILVHVRALLQIGSTSGWDILTGMLTGMLMLLK